MENPIDLENLKNAVNSHNALLADVREEHEWQQGHIKGALHLPLSKLSQLNLDLPQDKSIYLYCRSGGRVFPAAAFLKEHHPSIIPLKYGFQELVNAGFPSSS